MQVLVIQGLGAARPPARLARGTCRESPSRPNQGRPGSAALAQRGVGIVVSIFGMIIGCRRRGWRSFPTLIVGLMALLLLGFWKLQIVNSDRYAQLAERNRIRTIPIIAPRGSMLDREGRVMVDNYPSFSVLLLRDDEQQLARLLPQIADGLGLDARRRATAGGRGEIPAAFSAHRHQARGHTRGYRLHRVASRRPSRAGNAHGAPPALSAGRVSWHTPAVTWAKSAPIRSKPATAATGPAISSANPASKSSTTKP